MTAAAESVPTPNPPAIGLLAPSAAVPATTVVADALQRSRTRTVLVGLVVVLVGSTVLAIGLGPVPVAPSTVVRIVGHHVVGVPGAVDWSRVQDAVIWQVRLPRVLLGALVGMSLGAAGTALQALVRNPLAEPHLLGVSAGASTGAAAAILFGVGAGWAGWSSGAATSVVAFVGAVGALALVIVLARAGGTTTPGRMVVAGVAVGYVLHAVTSLLILFADSDDGARAVLFWLLGSVAQAEWPAVPVLAIAVAVGTGWLWWWRRRLDVLAISDDVARSVGVDPVRTRRVLIVVVALCVGATVAVAGGIGFVGLAVPHIARRAVGAAHRSCLPAAVLLGGTLIVWSDVAARTVLQPRELPIGIVTGLIGAPILVVLVRRLHRDPT